MLHYLQKLKESLLYLMYPPQCLHCEELMAYAQPLFCESCVYLLELIDPKERCPICFAPSQKQNIPCLECMKIPNLITRLGAAFDYVGPAASLIKKLKYSDQPYLACGAGAFLVAQLERLNWPLPDAIIPVPISFTHWMARGYNQSLLLAENISSFLQIPVWKVLKRRSGDYSQAGLTLAQRRSLEGKHFQIHQSYDLKDKILLLVDDVMTTGSTLKKCAETLLEGCPDSIYALTFCRAV